MSPDARMAVLRNHVAALMEHFDAVQVVATRTNGSGETETHSWGAGNWWARRGMMRAFEQREDASEAAQAIRDAMPPEDDA